MEGFIDSHNERMDAVVNEVGWDGEIDYFD